MDFINCSSTHKSSTSQGRGGSPFTTFTATIFTSGQSGMIPSARAFITRPKFPSPVQGGEGQSQLKSRYVTVIYSAGCSASTLVSTYFSYHIHTPVITYILQLSHTYSSYHVHTPVITHILQLSHTYFSYHIHTPVITYILQLSRTYTSLGL